MSACLEPEFSSSGYGQTGYDGGGCDAHASDADGCEGDVYSVDICDVDYCDGNGCDGYVCDVDYCDSFVCDGCDSGTQIMPNQGDVVRTAASIEPTKSPAAVDGGDSRTGIRRTIQTMSLV